jgi:hypothetical protein
MANHPSRAIENATADDYRAAGREAGEEYIAQYRGDRGIVKFVAAGSESAFNNALASAAAQMAAAGATLADLRAWAEGLAEAINEHTARLETAALIDRAVRDPDGLAGRGREAS